MEDKIEKCLVSAIKNLLAENEGIIVYYEDEKFIVHHYDYGIGMTPITDSDEEVVRNLPDGQIVHMEDE